MEGYERAKNILESNHGKTSEIIRSYIDNIQNLPVVNGANPAKIHKFCQTLTYNVQSLETLGKLSDSLSMVRRVLDKLPGIKADLVRNKVGWQDWRFAHLLQALQEWKDIHPVDITIKSVNKQPTPRGRSFHTRTNTHAHACAPQPRPCVYCDSDSHKSSECDTVTTISDWKRKLSEKGLCFSYTGSNHRAAKCPSKSSCIHCKQRHHFSICDREQPPKKKTVLTATNQGDKVCLPIVIDKVNGVLCRALLDTAWGHRVTCLHLLGPRAKTSTSTDRNSPHPDHRWRSDETRSGIRLGGQRHQR